MPIILVKWRFINDFIVILIIIVTVVSLLISGMLSVIGIK